ncbi:MAG: hypothetical protein IJU16_02165 [Clostridia bacterium]|nr:hypothetical protein [Clostridia bacterium]
MSQKQPRRRLAALFAALLLWTMLRGACSALAVPIMLADGYAALARRTACVPLERLLRGSDSPCKLVLLHGIPDDAARDENGPHTYMTYRAIGVLWIEHDVSVTYEIENGMLTAVSYDMPFCVSDWGTMELLLRKYLPRDEFTRQGDYTSDTIRYRSVAKALLTDTPMEEVTLSRTADTITASFHFCG